MVDGLPVIVGVGSSGFGSEPDLAIDEVVFEATRTALHDAGLVKSDVDLSVVASVDVFDGQSMSNGVTTPAAAGWLTNDYRLESDSGAALISAAAAIKAGAAEIAVVVGVHWPALAAGQFLAAAEASSVSFEPQFERPVGVTAAATLGLHASRLVSSGIITRDQLADVAAHELARSGTQVGVDAVLSAATVAWPLTAMMFPAVESGAAAVVLASSSRGKMCRRARAAVAGHGISNGGALSDSEWLTAPETSTRRAAREAYRRAGVDDVAGQIEIVEFTAPSVALVAPIRSALGADGIAEERVNSRRGALGASAGAATGIRRVIDTLHRLDEYGSRGSRGVAHTVDDLTGTVAATATVHVLEVL